jgi:pimeloyl-ACP methyl ester carboxylesterase
VILACPDTSKVATMRSPLGPRAFGAVTAAALALVTLPAPASAATSGTFTGTLGGAAYAVRVPASWNGRLVLYSHGYRQAAGGATAAQDAPAPAVATALLADGYAVAGSSYATNGWAVNDGVNADVALLSWFRSHVGTPTRVYAWGDSLGGLVTQMLAQRHPELVNGVAPMCGVLAGANRNFDLALDFEVAVQRLLYPAMKLTGYTSYAQAKAAFDGAFAAVAKAASIDPVTLQPNAPTNAGGIARLISVASLVDAPYKTRTADGSTLAKTVGGVVEAIATGLYYATVDRYEFEQRVGGNPSTNTHVDYVARINALDLSRFASFGFSTDLLRSLAGTVERFGTRVTANAAARTTAAGYGNPSGDLHDKTLTLHTKYDPLVLVQNETVFADRVAAHGDSASLVQLYTSPPSTYTAAPYGAGHCNFTTAEYVAVVRALHSWVSTGVRPTRSGVKAASGDPGFNTTFTPAAWPAY